MELRKKSVNIFPKIVPLQPHPRLPKNQCKLTVFLGRIIFCYYCLHTLTAQYSVTVASLVQWYGRCGVMEQFMCLCNHRFYDYYSSGPRLLTNDQSRANQRQYCVEPSCLYSLPLELPFQILQFLKNQNSYDSAIVEFDNDQYSSKQPQIISSLCLMQHK